MRTDIAIDKLCDIAPYVADIMDKVKDDKELKELVLKYGKENKTSNYLRFLPLLKDKCSEEVYNILAIVYGKTVEAVKEQDLLTETIPQIIELWNNKDIRSFFSFLTGKSKTEKEADELSTTYENTAEGTTQYDPNLYACASTSDIE